MSTSNFNILNKTENGKIYLCSSCNSIHFEFKNIVINFSSQEFKIFTYYFDKLKIELLEPIDSDSLLNQRVIILPRNDMIKLKLNNEEIEEIRSLLKFTKQPGNHFQRFILKSLQFSISMN
jgi:hypothetical protein